MADKERLAKYINELNTHLNLYDMITYEENFDSSQFHRVISTNMEQVFQD